MLSKISLYVATAEQTTASRKRTYAEWGRGLTLEEYLDREVVGEGEEFARDGKLITWVLAPRDDPTTLDFFCSCETFKRTIVISRPGKDNQEPIVEEGIGYGIASVFTAPGHRGKGYGKHMMRLLHWVLARDEYLKTQTFPEKEWGPKPERVPDAGEGWVSALWSDVGPTFYGECGMGVGSERGDGWIVRDPFSTVWKMKEVTIPEERSDKSGVVWLDENLVKGIWDEDAREIKEEVVQKAREEKKTEFSFLPNGGVAMFQWFRLHYHFSRYVPDPPKYCGVWMEGGTFATWTCEYRPGSPRTLVVTRLRADKKTIGGLIERVLRYAKRYGMEEVEAWNVPEEFEVGGKVVEREEHYSSMKWYSDEQVGWLRNEKFGWC